MAYDAARNQTVLFGGSYGTVRSDTWVWDGNTWSQRFPLVSPSPRYGHVMVYDSTRQEIVLFGGSNVSSTNTSIPYSDTWVWNGATWTQKFPATSPPGGYNHAMCYDHDRHEALLLTAFTNQTWVWDGNTWSQRFPLITPPGGIAHYNNLVYDGSHHEAVLFEGGERRGVGDTWVWNGATWTQKFPATSPPSMYAHAMAYDAARNQTVLYSGNSYNSSDWWKTWTWNGSTWVHIPTAASPQVYSPALVYNSSLRELILVGQGSVGGFQTWVFGASVGCPNAPRLIFSDLSGTAGFVDALTQNTQQDVSGGTISTIYIQNRIRVWRGVSTMQVGGGQLTSNSAAGPAGVAAALNLIPPCRTGFSSTPPFIGCEVPGTASWTARFCSPGVIDVRLSINSRSASVTMADILLVVIATQSGLPGAPQPISTVVGIADQLYTNVPTFKDAADCAASGVLMRSVGCIQKAFHTLAHDRQQRDAVIAILAGAGISVSAAAITSALLGTPLTVIQQLGDLIAYSYETNRIGNYNYEVVQIRGQ